jgi:hypothetical protein
MEMKRQKAIAYLKSRDKYVNDPKCTFSPKSAKQMQMGMHNVRDTIQEYRTAMQLGDGCTMTRIEGSE